MLRQWMRMVCAFLGTLFVGLNNASHALPTQAEQVGCLAQMMGHMHQHLGGSPAMNFRVVASLDGNQAEFRRPSNTVLFGFQTYYSRMSGYEGGDPNAYGKGWAFGTLAHEIYHWCAHNAGTPGCSAFDQLPSECQEFGVDWTTAMDICEAINCIVCEQNELEPSSPEWQELEDMKEGLEDKHQQIQDRWSAEAGGSSEAACDCALDHGGVAGSEDGVVCPECALGGTPLQVPDKLDVQAAIADCGSAIPECSSSPPAGTECDDCHEGYPLPGTGGGE